MKKPTAPVVRTLEAADSNYASAKDLVARLRASLSKLDSEESDLLTRLASRPAAPEVTGRVAALLGDTAVDDDGAPDGLRARLKAIASERVDVRAALDIATQRLASARFGASKVICGEVKSAYAERVRAVATAFMAAHEAHADLLQLIDQLNANDVAWTGYMAPMHAHRVIGHQSSKIVGWLREAADGGFIHKASIPVELL